MRSLIFRVTLAAAFVAIVVHAQGPAFEVAAIKPAGTPGAGQWATSIRGGPGTADPTRWRAENVSLFNLLAIGFELNPYQIPHAAWMESAHFDIEARVPPGAKKEQVPLMIQSLLRDRFHLTCHRENKEMAVLALVPAKGGPKLRPADAVPSDAPLGGARAAQNAGRNAGHRSGRKDPHRQQRKQTGVVAFHSFRNPLCAHRGTGAAIQTEANESNGTGLVAPDRKEMPFD